MKKKVLRWVVYICSASLILVLSTIFFLDDIAKVIAERRVRAQTGMETTIGKLVIGLREPTIHIQNFVLKNPPQFGGDTFLEIPELYLEYDRDALSAGRLHLNLVRLRLAQVHVVENKAGKKNVDEMQGHQPKSKNPNSRNNSTTTKPTFVFDQIDSLDVTLESVRFSSERHPEQNIQQNLGIKHEVFKNLKTDLDFQTAGMVLLLKAGLSGAVDLNSLLTNSKTGNKAKKLLEDVAEPLKLDPTKPQP